MLHISGFFDRYIKKHKEKESKDQYISGEITKVLGRIIDQNNYSIKGNVLFFTGTSFEKQKIFINKSIIISALKKNAATAHIQDIQ